MDSYFAGVRTVLLAQMRAYNREAVLPIEGLMLSGKKVDVPEELDDIAAQLPSHMHIVTRNQPRPEGALFLPLEDLTRRRYWDLFYQRDMARALLYPNSVPSQP